MSLALDEGMLCRVSVLDPDLGWPEIDGGIEEGISVQLHREAVDSTVDPAVTLPANDFAGRRDDCKSAQDVAGRVPACIGQPSFP